MINFKYYKYFFMLFLSFFCFNICILSINALHENSESLITISYFKKKYIIDFDVLLKEKIEKNFQQYIISKYKYYINNHTIFHDVLYDKLSNKKNFFKKITIIKNNNILIDYGKKFILLNGHILLINGELINLSKSTVIRSNNHLLKNNIYISSEKSFLKSENENAILFLSN